MRHWWWEDFLMLDEREIVITEPLHLKENCTFEFVMLHIKCRNVILGSCTLSVNSWSQRTAKRTSSLSSHSVLVNYASPLLDRTTASVGAPHFFTLLGFETKAMVLVSSLSFLSCIMNVLTYTYSSFCFCLDKWACTALKMQKKKKTAQKREHRSDWRNWKAIFSVSEVGPLTFPSPLYSYFSKPLTYFESLTTSELQQQWKKQRWAAVILTYVSPLYTQTKPLCFFWGQKTLLLFKFFPLILAQICWPCTKLWCSFSELTRRRNENKRSRKAMNHVCHHQRGARCGSLLGSYRPLEVMEEVRPDLYTQKHTYTYWCTHIQRCSHVHAKRKTHLPHIRGLKQNPCFKHKGAIFIIQCIKSAQ